MLHIAKDAICNVVCVSVGWAHGWACAKTGEPIEMPFGIVTHVGSRNT